MLGQLKALSSSRLESSGPPVICARYGPVEAPAPSPAVPGRRHIARRACGHRSSPSTPCPASVLTVLGFSKADSSTLPMMASCPIGCVPGEPGTSQRGVGGP